MILKFGTTAVARILGIGTCLLVHHSVNCQTLVENFDHVNTIYQNGWSQQNMSQPLGPGTWQQDYGNFNAFSGHDSSSIVCSFRSTSISGSGTISNWLFTPVLNMNEGDTLFFYTNSYRNNPYPDRMEVRMSVNGNSTNVGTSSTTIGDFDSLLLTINPNLTLDGYPMAWFQYKIPIHVPAPNTSGRIAFRYYVTDGGGGGSNSSAIGIDNFRYQSVTDVGVPEFESTLFVYPNPSETTVHIRSTSTSIDKIEVIDMAGHSTVIPVNMVNYDMTVKDWASGVYVLHIYWQGESRPSAHKLIVQ